MSSPSNRYPRCVVCGERIDESVGEVPVYIEPCDDGEFGEYDGTAYHLNKCEGGIFEEVYAEL